jgi:regulator of protease activity HflC (stomatin/prohibitin superfamily)
MNNRSIVGLIILVIIAVAALFTMSSAFYHQDANQIAVVQGAVDGKLTVSTEPGLHQRWYGKVTFYPRRGQIDFDNLADNKENDGVLHIPKLGIRFNDGAEAAISGSLAWEMPINHDQIITLHKTYGSASAIENQIIVKNIGKAVYMTGPLMSSAESYATRRNDLLSLVYDQVEHGAYKTESRDIRALDPLTGQEKTVRVVNIALDSRGLPMREDTSLISMLGLHTFNLTLDGIQYPVTVEQQIQNQQQSLMAVQTAIAKAKTAEQDALTIEQQGKATAAAAKWEQETVKAKEVTIAEKNLQVAQLSAQAQLTNSVILAQMKVLEAELAAKAAAATKAAAILLGEGEAQAAQLKMQANGALEQKLATYERVQAKYAEAISNYKGNWVPSTVFGGTSTGTSSAGNGASQFIELLTAKAARDLSLDLSTTVNTYPTKSGK